MSVTPESVLSGMPGWDAAVVRELTGGLTNRTWLVESGQKKAVLKIDERSRSVPFNRRQIEAQIQTSAAKQGLANPVLIATETVYMTEYLDGHVWARADLDDDDNLLLLGQALRRLHALPLSGRSFDARQAARHYARSIDDADPELLRDNLRIVDSMPPPGRLRCCHNDLVAGNIITTPEVHFLDWEYACDNDPFFDLATVVAHHRLSPERSSYLLNAYFDGEGERWREQLAMYERFYSAILWLWQAARD